MKERGMEIRESIEERFKFWEDGADGPSHSFNYSRGGHFQAS
jgi:hypothetical protein